MSTLEDANVFYNSLLKEFYQYCYLESMHDKILHTDSQNPYRTMVLGLSYGITDVDTFLFDTKAVNLAMNSQDLFYDMMHVYRIMQEKNYFTDCIFVLGYYSFYFDLSMGINKMECLTRYAPLFDTVHHAEEYKDLIGRVKTIVCAADFVNWYHEYFKKHPSYYGDHYPRELENGFFGDDRAYVGDWQSTTQENRNAIAAYRTGRHNKIRYPNTFRENIELFGMTMKMLDAAGISTHVVIPPFSAEYMALIDPAFKKEMLEVLDEMPYPISFTDFNETDGFECQDFADADHLNMKGAVKFSKMLNNVLQSFS